MTIQRIASTDGNVVKISERKDKKILTSVGAIFVLALSEVGTPVLTGAVRFSAETLDGITPVVLALTCSALLAASLGTSLGEREVPLGAGSGYF